MEMQPQADHLSSHVLGFLQSKSVLWQELLKIIFQSQILIFIIIILVEVFVQRADFFSPNIL